MPKSTARYIELIHLSDLHFGKDHRFSAEKTADGAAPAEDGFPTLADKIIQDLTDPANEPPRPTLLISALDQRERWSVPPMPKIGCLSGDFTVDATKGEFLQAAGFVKRLMEPAPQGLGFKPDTLFVCPGNHDLDWNAEGNELRWREYATFLNDIYPEKHNAADASYFGGVKVHDELGVIVLSLNSETAVKNKDKDKTRGDLSQAQLEWAENLLNQVPKDKRESYIKVAMVHHHPILLPALAEPGRGYDAISGAQHLLTLLHRFRFHVLLHGHKHYPHTFHEDVRNAFERTDEHSLVVIAGGSCGSKGLPEKPSATQTYNRIRIHWCADQQSIRIQIVTRGLVRQRSDGTDLFAKQWHWITLALDDRHFLFGRGSHATSLASMRYTEPEPAGSPAHAARTQEYQRTRGNFPTAQVRPSLLPTQVNEAQLRIERHDVGGAHRKPSDDPVTVTWSAGAKFPVVRINATDDPTFSAVFAYYGSALFQAELEFSDHQKCCVFIYAPMLPSPVQPKDQPAAKPGNPP